MRSVDEDGEIVYKGKGTEKKDDGISLRIVNKYLAT